MVPYKKRRELALSLPCEDVEKVAVYEPGRGKFPGSRGTRYPGCGILLGHPEHTRPVEPTRFRTWQTLKTSYTGQSTCSKVTGNCKSLPAPPLSLTHLGPCLVTPKFPPAWLSCSFGFRPTPCTLQLTPRVVGPSPLLGSDGLVTRTAAYLLLGPRPPAEPVPDF